MKNPNQIRHSFRLHTLHNRSGCIGCAYRDPNKISAKCQDELFKDVREYIKQLEVERDFLLKYMTDSTFAFCDICKHDIDGSGVMGCKHIREHGVPCFEWRGVQKED